MIRVALPFHLQTLARVDREISVQVEGIATQKTVLDALEKACPMLRGTIRDHLTLERRPKVRFYADGKDVTHESPDSELPQAIVSGAEPFRIVGAISGG
ncbi:MAG TPA: MoaD/ThiS family protein [Woeseiaceae bacterium]|nr:MoaD/ThiS family protein [Woeseiaceae bacterium]